MPLITYRAAKADDADALAQLRYEMEVERYPQRIAFDRETYLAVHHQVTRDWLARGGYDAWFAEADGTPVACVILMVWELHPNGRELHRRRGLVTGVYTQPAYRRQGIARRLMELLLARARELGVHRLILWASDMGRPLYEELGFMASRAMELNL
jgi:GNAT superfamily N-acetyltransferase